MFLRHSGVRVAWHGFLEYIHLKSPRRPSYVHFRFDVNKTVFLRSLQKMTYRRAGAKFTRAYHDCERMHLDEMNVFFLYNIF